MKAYIDVRGTAAADRKAPGRRAETRRRAVVGGPGRRRPAVKGGRLCFRARAAQLNSKVDDAEQGEGEEDRAPSQARGQRARRRWARQPGPMATIRFHHCEPARPLSCGRARVAHDGRGPITSPAQPPSAWRSRATIRLWTSGANAAARAPPSHRARGPPISTGRRPKRVGERPVGELADRETEDVDTHGQLHGRPTLAPRVAGPPRAGPARRYAWPAWPLKVISVSSQRGALTPADSSGGVERAADMLQDPDGGPRCPCRTGRPAHRPLIRARRNRLDLIGDGATRRARQQDDLRPSVVSHLPCA